jgi:hypothetical protein
VAKPETVSRRGKTAGAANENKARPEGREEHYIMIDASLYDRIETVAKARGMSVVDLVDYSIHRTLDAIYMAKARG